MTFRQWERGVGSLPYGILKYLQHSNKQFRSNILFIIFHMAKVEDLLLSCANRQSDNISLNKYWCIYGLRCISAASGLAINHSTFSSIMCQRPNIFLGLVMISEYRTGTWGKLPDERFADSKQTAFVQRSYPLIGTKCKLTISLFPISSLMYQRTNAYEHRTGKPGKMIILTVREIANF